MIKLDKDKVLDTPELAGVEAPSVEDEQGYLKGIQDEPDDDAG